MPMVKFTTNVPNEAIPADFEARFCKEVAASMNKPLEVFAFEVRGSARMYQNGNAPLAIVTVKSIGQLEPQQTVQHSGVITKFAKELGIDAARCLIQFQDLNPKDVGVRGSTVQGLGL